LLCLFALESGPGVRSDRSILSWAEWSLDTENREASQKSWNVVISTQQWPKSDP